MDRSTEQQQLIDLQWPTNLQLNINLFELADVETANF